ncbi:MAG TPA: autotransporter-associated beta strand repeat-containing protein, partial [Pirellulales bacterium]
NTVGSPSVGGFEAIPSSALYYASSNVPTFANGYNFAAIISNNYTLASGQTATIDTLGTTFGAVVNPATGASLALGNNSILNIVNGSTGNFGAGWIGFDGSSNGNTSGITIGNGVILATTNTASNGAGTLNLIGNITETGTGANALVKAGTGTLVLGGNNSSTFTGQLVVQGGTVQLTSASALPGGTGSIVVSSTNILSTVETGLPTATVGSNTITLGGTDTTTTLGLQVGMQVSSTAGIPVGSYITALTGSNTFTISQGTTATLAALAYNATGMLDLNGQTSVAGNVTINGAGGQYFPSVSVTATSILAAASSGALWNSSPIAASLAGTLTLGSNSSVGGYGNLTLGTIAVSSGTPTLTKTGTDTLILNAANTSTFNTAVTLGTLQLGAATGLGAASNTVTVTSGAVFDLNGQTVGTNPLTISGVGYGGSAAVTGAPTTFAVTDPSAL